MKNHNASLALPLICSSYLSESFSVPNLIKADKQIETERWRALTEFSMTGGSSVCLISETWGWYILLFFFRGRDSSAPLSQWHSTQVLIQKTNKQKKNSNDDDESMHQYKQKHKKCHIINHRVNFALSYWACKYIVMHINQIRNPL